MLCIAAVFHGIILILYCRGPRGPKGAGKGTPFSLSAVVRGDNISKSRVVRGSTHKVSLFFRGVDLIIHIYIYILIYTHICIFKIYNMFVCFYV